MKYKGLEKNFQITVAREMDRRTVYWFHPANERKTKRKVNPKTGRTYSPEGMVLSAQGVKSGLPDIMCLEKRNGFSGLAIELKVFPNKPTPSQLNWLEKLKRIGFKTLCSDDLDEVLKEIDNYFK